MSPGEDREEKFVSGGSCVLCQRKGLQYLWMVAADAFMVPLVPQYLVLEGLINLLEVVDRILQGIGTKVEL